MKMNSPGTLRAASMSALLLIVMLAPITAQTPQFAATGAATSAVPAAAVSQLDLLVGRSAVVRIDERITRVSLPMPDVADALVTSPNEVLVHGKAPGTISMLVWTESGAIRSYDVSVRRDLKSLEQRVQQLFPGEPITVSSN